MPKTQPESEWTATRWTAPQGEAISLHKRRANEYMRDALLLLDPDEPIPFFCECDRTECFATVPLSGAGFDRVRVARDRRLNAHGEALLLPIAA